MPRTLGVVGGFVRTGVVCMLGWAGCVVADVPLLAHDVSVGSYDTHAASTDTVLLDCGPYGGDVGRGASWTYGIDHLALAGMGWVVSVRAVDEASGTATLSVVVLDEPWMEAWRCDAWGLSIADGGAFSEGGTWTYDPPLKVLPRAPEVGQRWTQEGLVTDHLGRSHVRRWTHEVVAVDASIPVGGLFGDVAYDGGGVRIVTVAEAANGRTWTATRWWAQGIGMVREAWDDNGGTLAFTRGPLP